MPPCLEFGFELGFGLLIPNKTSDQILVRIGPDVGSIGRPILHPIRVREGSWVVPTSDVRLWPNRVRFLVRIVADSDARFFQRIVSESGPMSIVSDVRFYTRIGSDLGPGW